MGSHVLMKRHVTCSQSSGDPQANGKMRMLGIPTVMDRIVQTAVKGMFEAQVEPVFHADSYAYRPKKSALDAIGAQAHR